MTSATLSFVVDASVAVKLFLNEPLTSQAIDLFDRLADEKSVAFHIPDLFYVECANIFWKQCQRGNAVPSKAQADLALLGTLQLQRTSTFDLMNNALTIALTHGISAYDACYVTLAHREGIPMVTADEKLVNKLASTPYQVGWLGNLTLP